MGNLAGEFLDTYEVKLPATYYPAGTSVRIRQPQTFANTPSAQPIAEPDRTSHSATYMRTTRSQSRETLWNISKRYPGTTPDWIAESMKSPITFA